MDYVQHTQEQRQAMLEAIGVHSVDDLYASLARKYRLNGPLPMSGLEQGLSELELRRRLAELGAINRPAADGLCFLGGGAYDHFIPAAVDALAHQGAFVTAYTPYQAEASQGALQAFFEFQTQVCQITGLDVSNASLYEGATAVAEAAMLALNHTGRRRVLVSAGVHPHFRQVLATYLMDLPAKLVEVPVRAGQTDATALGDLLDHDTACVIIAAPNVYGIIEDWSALFAQAKAKGDGKAPLCVAVFNPIACGLLKTPGACGADVAAGEGQPLGIPLQMGGPYLGLFAVRQPLMRRMPGRLVGQTVDTEGRRAFCLTLQTREQHIRRDKATSNICTNQGLLALRATVYLSAVGRQGLRQVALQCFHKAHQAAHRINSIAGFHTAYEGEFFHEFVVNCPVPAQQIIDAGRERKIFPGLSCQKLGIGSENQLLLAVTEKRSSADINTLTTFLREFARA